MEHGRIPGKAFVFWTKASFASGVFCMPGIATHSSLCHLTLGMPEAIAMTAKKNGKSALPIICGDQGRSPLAEGLSSPLNHGKSMV